MSVVWAICWLRRLVDLTDVWVRHSKWNPAECKTNHKQKPNGKESRSAQWVFGFSHKSKRYVCLKISGSYEILSLTASNPLQLLHCFHGNKHMYEQCSSTKSSMGLFDTAFGQWKSDLNATGLKERAISAHKLKVALTELEATQVPSPLTSQSSNVKALIGSVLI